MNENENMTPETGAAQPAKLDVDVRVYPSKEEGNLLAFASVTLGGCFAVKGIKIMDGEKALLSLCPTGRTARASITTSVSPLHRRCGRPSTPPSWASISG